MKRYSNILLFGLVSLFLWSCTKENAVDPNNGSNKEMRVVASVLKTRAGMEDVTDIKAFMLDVKSGGNSKYDYYVAVKPDGIGWKSYSVAADGTIGAAKQMLWADATSPVVATALYLSNNAETVLSADKYINAEINVVKDQTTEDAVKQCDYLYMPATTIYPTTDNGAVNVAFRHLMAKLNIMLYMGTEFNVNPGTDVNPVTEIKIKGVATKGIFDALSNSWSDAADNTATEVMPYCAQYSAGSGLIKRATARYEAILIPEIIDPGKFGLSITVNGKTYNWTSEQAIWIEGNYSYSIPVTVGKNFVSVGSVQVAEWNAGAELNDGETDVEDIDVWDGVTVATGLTVGTGTKDDPYIVTSGAELAYIAQVVNSRVSPGLDRKYFTLTKDIDLGDHEWTPIGFSEGAHGKSFTGVFDGNNHTIYNLKVVSTVEEKASGFFGSIGPAPDGEYTVKNLTIKNAHIESESNAGILAGVMNSVYPSEPYIANCHVSGTVKVPSSSTNGGAGGLIGRVTYGHIEGCTADAVVTGHFCSGGLVGTAFKSTLENCSAKGSVSGSWEVGGFCGSLVYSSTAKYCTTSVNVEAIDWNVGGFTGWLGVYNDGSISDMSYMVGCSASGRVFQKGNGYWQRHLGGLVGIIRYGQISDSHFDGELDSSQTSGNEYVGAFVGYDKEGGKTVSCWYKKSGVQDGIKSVGVIDDESSSSHDITAK